MKMINYVLASWSGLRDSPSTIPYIQTHLEQLSTLKTKIDQITIGYPHNPNESKIYKNYINSLKYINNIPIYIEPMANHGRSYGQYDKIFQKYKDQFKYWILMEDDYVPVLNNFDSIMVSIFDKTKKETNARGGFLCQIAKRWCGAPYHAAISNGITDNESLNIINNKFKCLPHDKIGYKNGQVIFSRAFLECNLFLKDMQHRFKAPYFHLRNGIEEHNKKGHEYIIVPIQMIKRENLLKKTTIKNNKRNIKLI